MKEFFLSVKKWIYRLINVLSLVLTSFFIFKKKRWIIFWFTNKDRRIRTNSMEFYVRCSNLLTKISDLSMLFEILIYKQYDICKIKELDIIIDIGAHIGGYTLLASREAKNGKVYAYEPFVDSYNYLKKNINLNNRTNIFAFNQAVSNKNGKIIFYINKMNLTESSLNKKTKHKCQVKAVTLSKIFSDNKLNHCDVLKVDCEGEEYKIFFSSKKLLKKIDRIIMECHVPKYFGISKKYSPKGLVEYLKKNNFDVIMEKRKYYQGIIYAKKKLEKT